MTDQIEVERTASEKGKAPAAVNFNSLPWIEKYRPLNVEELVSHEEIISTIVKFVDSRKLPHLLFYGPPGTGKTSTILASARRMYGKDYKQMILELNASDDRGIDVVREQIISFASTKQMMSASTDMTKLIILDEADSMTNAAQSALRRVMEKYTRNVRFCIICNYVSKIIPAIQSRCTRFRFAPLESAQIKSRLQVVVKQEGVHMTDDGYEALLKLSCGDMRRALNVMQSVHGAYNLVNEQNVYLCVGSPLPRDIESVVNALLQMDFRGAHQFISSLKAEKGLALSDLITQVFEFIANIEFPRSTKAFIVKEMAEIEHRLSIGCSEKIQTSALISTFQIGKDMAVQTGHLIH